MSTEPSPDLPTAEQPTLEVPALSRTCPSCGEHSPADANWCEACGHDLNVTPALPAYVATGPCVSCGAPIEEITDDGWCQLCGTKQPDPNDHVVDDRGWFGIVSDKGRKHRGNEDAGAVGANAKRVALVVCDGVGSTTDAHEASQTAAGVARDVLVTSDIDDPNELLQFAAASAQQAVLDATAQTTAADAPSSTFVAVVASAGLEPDLAHLRVGWLGDSRVYWLGANEAALLTHDHTWANEQAALGELTEAEIEADELRHSITRWLGRGAPDISPQISELAVQGPGLVLVCSDGLWNYAPAPETMRALVARLTAEAHEPRLIDLAEALVAFANESGGHDNITVALARVPLELETAPGSSSDGVRLDELDRGVVEGIGEG